MDQLFWIKVGFSFVLGSGWIMAATVAGDRWGSRIGGLLAGMPSTIAFSLFFIALTQNALTATQATTIEPIVWGISNLYVLTYIWLAKKNFWIALLGGLAIWLGLSVGLILAKFNSYSVSLLAYLAALTFAYLMIEKVFKIKAVSGKKIKYTPLTIGTRGLLSGSIVALSVILSKIGGPTWGGAFSAFPAIFTSTLLITYFTRGVDFSLATIKSALFGSISLIVYSAVVRYTYIPVGLWGGTFLALFASVVSGYLIYRYVLTRLA